MRPLLLLSALGLFSSSSSSRTERLKAGACFSGTDLGGSTPERDRATQLEASSAAEVETRLMSETAAALLPDPELLRLKAASAVLKETAPELSVRASEERARPARLPAAAAIALSGHEEPDVPWAAVPRSLLALGFDAAAAAAVSEGGTTSGWGAAEGGKGPLAEAAATASWGRGLLIPCLPEASSLRARSLFSLGPAL